MAVMEHRNEGDSNVPENLKAAGVAENLKTQKRLENLQEKIAALVAALQTGKTETDL